MSMKTNKILLYTLLALPALLMQSCLKDQEDIFDKPASQRMSEYLQGAQEALVSAPYGWSFDYYPEENQSYGGFTYTIGFSNDADTVRFENNPDDGQLVSLYKMKSDDGPVLSFDTYNSFLHKYATPTDGKYQAEKGDFEFVIDSVGSDIIKVHGKKTGNTLYLRKLTEPAAQYMQKVVDMGDSFFPSEADLTIGGKPYQLVFTDLTNRQADIYDNGTYLTTTAYNFTDKGLRFYQPLSLNGVSVQDFTYDDDKLTLSADGVETSKFTVSPSVVASIFGDMLSGYNGKTVTKTIPHLDQFNVTCDASWVHISKSGNKLTVKVDATTDTKTIRKANIVFKNGDYKDSVNVSQYELSALLGSYKLKFKGASESASLGYEEAADGSQNLYLTVQGEYATLKFPLIYLSGSQSLLMQSGQLIGTASTNSGATYSLGNVFIYGGGSYWSSYRDNFFDLLSIEPGDKGGVNISLQGALLYTPDGSSLQSTGMTVEEIFIEAFESYPFTSSNLLGYLERWTSPVLVKTASAPAKGGVSTGNVAGSREYKMRAINPVRRSFFDFAPYRMESAKQFKLK